MTSSRKQATKFFPVMHILVKKLLGFFSAYLPKCTLPCFEGKFQIFLLVAVILVLNTPRFSVKS